MASVFLYGGIILSYRIEYANPHIRKRNRKGGYRTIVGLIASLAIIILSAFLISLKQQTKPTTVTGKALSAFSEELTRGEDLADAFTVFCKEIISGAGIS